MPGAGDLPGAVGDGRDDEAAVAPAPLSGAVILLGGVAGREAELSRLETLPTSKREKHAGGAR